MKYLRKTFRITAAMSPNVLAGEALRRKHPDWPDELVDREAYKVGVPGLIGWREYHERRRTYDPIKACVSLDARWYKGAAAMLFPEEWLRRAANRANELGHQEAQALGVDTGEGEADTCWVVGGRLGIVELLAKKTKDTTECVTITLGLMKTYGLKPEQVCFDAGGGGRQHADRLRSQGFNVQVVGFGEMVSIREPKRKGVYTPFGEKVEKREDRQFLLNRRAEMYWDFALANAEPDSYGVPARYNELHRQLSLIPRCYDDEGKFYVPRKGDPTMSREERMRKNKPTLIDLVGCSPDHSDACVVMYYCMTHPKKVMRAGAL